jgi:hypothetical protein
MAGMDSRVARRVGVQLISKLAEHPLSKVVSALPFVFQQGRPDEHSMERRRKGVTHISFEVWSRKRSWSVADIVVEGCEEILVLLLMVSHGQYKGIASLQLTQRDDISVRSAAAVFEASQ